MDQIDSYYENMKPSAQNKSTKLTLFDDHHNNSNANDHDYCPSDCESVISGTENELQFRLSDNGLVRINDGDRVYEAIKKKLVSSLSALGFNAQVEAVHRSDFSDITKQAKLQSFSIHSRAMEMKCGGNVNATYAWYGASKDEIDRIISFGFSLLPMSSQTHGQGVYLSPVDRPFESMQSAVTDEDGLKHMLLCRVILGKTEVVCRDSEQFNPSSEEFDSGVDNLMSPQKYIIWTSRMNTHILPEFVVSFRASSSISRGFQRSSQPSKRPSYDWMPFQTLITVLSTYLPQDAVELITKHHDDYKKQKISRHEMIQRVRHIAGDKLLMTIIKSYRRKIKAPLIKGSSTGHHLNGRN